MTTDREQNKQFIQPMTDGSTLFSAENVIGKQMDWMYPSVFPVNAER
jgi:hypothetical protein